MNNVQNLKGKTNDLEESYRVNKQLPEQLMEQNRKVREIINEQKEKDKDLPVRDRAKIEVFHKKVFINGDVKEDYLKPIEINDLFPDKVEKEKQDKIKMTSSDMVTEENSTFLAYAIKANQIHDVRRAYRKVRRLHASADHVIGAYSIRNHKGYQDDAEHSAGYKLLNECIIQKKLHNVAVFVVRVFGGQRLGPRRFHFISSAGHQALQRLFPPT